MTLSAYDRHILNEGRAIRAKLRKEAKARAPKPPAKPRLEHKRAQPVAKGQREPRVREPVYLQWVRRLPCICCVREGVTPKPSQAAHIRAGYSEAGWRPTGMQEKPSDRRSAPLCQHHHLDGPKAQHRAGERQWWADLGVYPPHLCAALSAAFDAGADGAAVIRQFARRDAR